jgi:hypothetical protein
MKQLLLVIFLGLMYCSKLFAITVCEVKSQEEKINVIFENNMLGKGTKQFKLTIIDPSGNKTIETFSLSDDSRRKTVALEVGSKVYVDNSAQLNTLEGGKAPDKSAAFLIVMLRDKNQSMHLVEETNTSQAVVEANAQKSADKLKLAGDATKEILVNGNTVTVTYTSTTGEVLAEFDCDKKNGNVKNINDLRKKNKNKTSDEKSKSNVDKAKSLFGK